MQEPVTKLRTREKGTGNGGGRGEERVTGGSSRTARLQYLSAPEPGGHQPRNRHDVNDPLLLALQKELTSNLLWVLVFLLLQWAPKRMGPGATDTDPKATRPRPKATATSRKTEQPKVNFAGPTLKTSYVT